MALPPTLKMLRRATASLVVGLPLLLAGCDLFRMSLVHNDRDAIAAPSAALPSRYQHRVSQFVFISDSELGPYQPLLTELSHMREDVVTLLKLPNPTALVNVYLFEDRERYEQFMKVRYPDLPLRRAFFVAQPRGMSGGDDLLVFTFRGDHIRQDLRHELTHAILHSVLRDVPLWLDEGLAEYFELPREVHGVNRPHLAQMQRDGFRPDLGRLELLTQVQQMNPAEYREAWAWTHMMLQSNPESRRVLTDYLKQLRTTPTPGPIQPKLKNCYPDLNEALLAHLAKL
ncbi:MAG: hypothetical protein ACJ8F7_01845 [Gemmataceae bacterium]